MDKEKLTPEMLEYLQAAEEEKRGKEKKEALRETVINQFRLSGKKFEGFSYSRSRSYKIDEALFFAWIAETWPDLVKEMKQDLIDPVKFASFHDQGLISYEEIPEWVYAETYSDRLTPRRKKI